ncbi:MAG: hypothetical protein RL417_1139 [Pseudomonadota bacterium]
MVERERQMRCTGVKQIAGGAILFGRGSRQRRYIFELLQTTPTPLTALQILRATMRIAPRVNRSTVYRFLNELAAHGLVGTIGGVCGEAHYYLTTNSAHRSFFICIMCRGVTDFGPKTPVVTLPTPPGYLVERSTHAVLGRCPRCHHS